MAITQRPFSNGSEGYGWMGKWCSYCARDHSFHRGGDEQNGCDLILFAMMPDFPNEDFPWPEAWLPEPDDGQFYMPPRLICAAFQPCHTGHCQGDPGAEDRAKRVAEVAAYWQNAERSRPKPGPPHSDPSPSAGDASGTTVADGPEHCV